MGLFGHRDDVAVPGRTASPPSTVIPALLVLCAGVLGVLHVVVRTLAWTMPTSQVFTALEPMVHLDREANLPTWFTASLWVGAALLALRLRRSVPVDARSWTAVAGVCLFLSLDETIGLHEKLGDAFIWIGPEFLPGRLQFIYIWTIFGAAFAIVIAAGLLRFVLRQPRYAAVAILLAGAVFVAGAIGTELVSSALEAGILHADEESDWIVVVLIEEMMEMLGVIVFIHALLWLVERAEGRAGGSVRFPA